MVNKEELLCSELKGLSFEKCMLTFYDGSHGRSQLIHLVNCKRTESTVPYSYCMYMLTKNKGVGYPFGIYKAAGSL